MPHLDGNTTQLQALLDRAAQGDEGVYGDLIGRASERLLKLTRKMLRNYPQLRRWEETDDVFQNVAIRLQRSLNNLKPNSVGEFFGLATVEIRRALIDLLRHHFGPEGAAGKHQSDLVGASKSDGGVLQNQPDRSSRPESMESWARFHEAAERLPTDERDVFDLVWYGGTTQKEAAALLGVSVPTIKRRWCHARLLLHTALDGEPPLTTETE